MKSQDLTIRMIKNTSFPEAYKNLLLDKEMSPKKYRTMLSIATLFLNSTNDNVKKLGYRIIVLYCNQSGNYKPLYDIAANTGIIPVSQFIEDKMSEENKNVFTEINAANNMNYYENNVYCTAQQKELIDFYKNNNNNSLSIVAPTSYGKTDLIIDTVKSNEGKNICIITPTKSLLVQTKARISRACKNGQIKIITHPEMYNKRDNHILAVMTQERVLRLLKKDAALRFDYVIIDEAHGLLRDDDRNTLLAAVILFLTKRNPNTVFKFLTPFLCDSNNIKVRYSDFNPKDYKVNEYIKTEKIYLAELRNGYSDGLLYYDQFLNEFYSIEEMTEHSEIDFVCKHAGAKNIVYFNKPKDIEEFVINLNRLAEIKTTTIEKACKNIAEYVHPKYRLIDAIRHGAIYHHGDVPEPVRMYIEKLYSSCDEIRYVITSSTLLEGVNLPAEKMFILDNKRGNGNLSPSDFKNLIGRVCRFNQIFDSEKGSLKLLEPEIYLVVGKYYSSNANVRTFLEKSMYVEKKSEDELENVLLDKTRINAKNEEQLNKAKEFIENYEGGIIPDFNLRKANTKTGKICFANNITEIDVISNEEKLEEYVTNIKQQGHIIDNTQELIDMICNLFLSKSDEDSMKRFDYKETRRFYKMFLDWRIENTSLNQMIASFMKYWKELISDPQKEKLIYVGRWGDITRGGVRTLWTDISKKSDEELINLAIVRIKEEQDFLDNELIKYVETFNDLELLDEKLYLTIKYGTDDSRIISCTRNGISLSLAKLLVEKYGAYFSIDTNNDTLNFDEGIIDAMKLAGENEIMICELGFFM